MSTKWYILFLSFLSVICFSFIYILSLAYEGSESWIILQLNAEGTPVKCFTLDNKGLDTTANGLVWENKLSEKVYISAPYRAVRVSFNRWESAYLEAGISSRACSFLETSLIEVAPHINRNPQYKQLDSLGKHLDNIY